MNKKKIIQTPNSEEECEISDKENKKDIIEEIKVKNLSSNEYNLILGDNVILSKIEKIKKKKKVKSPES